MYNPLTSQLPKSDSELLQHLKALSDMKGDDGHRDIFDHLYGCLTILDDKSAALLSFNSIITAVFALFILSKEDMVLSVLLYGGIVLLVMSCLLLLSVVWIHWSGTEELQDLDQHGLTLLRVRRTRTIRYRLAWFFSTLSMVSLFVYILLFLAIS
jgi:hypothetical protein